ncbi:MAG TPA: flagellar export chaperone FliS [Desulfobulbus sp.]|nr:flagellar export chaperone FliS [Desulfobulbus sp.]
MNGYTNNYLANQVNTASPEQLMLMLYDGAVRFAALAIKAIEENDPEKRATYINKTYAILSEFSATLDYDQDAQLAENLDALYSYMQQQLMNASLKNDPEPVKEVKTMLSDLRQTWAQAIEQNKQEQQPVQEVNGTTRGKHEHHPLAVAM